MFATVPITNQWLYSLLAQELPSYGALFIHPPLIILQLDTSLIYYHLLVECDISWRHCAHLSNVQWKTIALIVSGVVECGE